MGHFEVRNEQAEGQLHDIGRIIADSLPDGWGFTLLLFEFGAGGSTFYLSNARRDDMVRALQEFIERQQRDGAAGER